ncbi:Copine-3 [Bonamia ostreae]|uniref:Copine-3 n=1 Tax=Bonamia ostreae TaxID=126728 RepID=A0ABV2AP99_9EUKA
MESQCFSLTFDPQKPFVESTEEAIEFYNSAVKRRQVGQCGRKIIGEVLNTIKMVSDRQVRAGKACYDILFLMFSNGSFVDRSNLANLLVEISVKPISFVFIGMGPGDFEEYKFLNKLKLKSSSGKKSFRDNASFFNFRDIVEGHTPDKTRTVLFSHIDRRIRQQVLEYFHNKKLSPENIFEGTESDRYQDNFNFNHVQ